MNLDEAIAWVRAHESDDEQIVATALQELVNDAVFAERAVREEENAKLTAMIAELHRMLGRGDHGNASDNHACAVSRLADVLIASRQNSEESAVLESAIDILMKRRDRELYEADTKGRAEAWDEGYRAGGCDEAEAPIDPRTENPYRNKPR